MLVALVLATSCFGQEACQSDLDINANGAVDIADFLNVLGLFGDVDSDGDGVWDSQDFCTDVEACNYAASPTEPCLFLDVIGICGGGCESDADGDGVCDFIECGDWKTFQGYDYATVELDGRCWFAENLRSTAYANGDSIPFVGDNAWPSIETGAATAYGIGWGCNSNTLYFDSCDPVLSQAVYGLLYNHYAVDDPRGICPVGWSVPSDDEWSAMIDSFGGIQVAGLALKDSTGWEIGQNGTNSSGFAGKPGGGRFGDSGFNNDAGLFGYFHSLSHEEGLFYVRKLLAINDGVERILQYPTDGFQTGYSVRCIQDSE